jgi:DNA-binding CsgD family transcriptional regulator/PAS domain-containing protein
MPELDASAVIDAIYAAAHTPDRWHTAIAAITELLGGAGATIEVHDRTERRLVFFADVGMPDDGVSVYIDHYHSVCPRLPWGPSTPAGTPIYDYMFLREREMARSEFYEDFLLPYGGFRYLIGGAIRNDPDELAVLAVHRLADRGHADERDIEVTRDLLGHLHRARRIEHELDAAGVRERALALAADTLAVGVVVLDVAGRVLHANTAATRLSGAGVIEIGDRLTAVAATDRPVLSRLVADAAGDPPRGGVALVGTAQLRPLSVTAVPHPPPDRAEHVVPPLLPPPSRRRPAAVVYLADPSRQPGLDARVLRAGFGLTGAEARLALALVTGTSLSDYAERRGISRHTARALLARVRGKLGVSSQRELVRLLLMLAPPVDPPP